MSESTLFDLPSAPEQFSVLLPPAELRRIDFSALEFATARKAVIEYMRTYYPNDFNDFVANNGVIMLVELISYVTALLSMRADILANEAFLPTARSEDSVKNHLALIGQKQKGATPSAVEIECSVDSPVSADIKIKPSSIAPFEIRGGDGTSIVYELFSAPDDVDSDIIIPAGKRATIALAVEGKTKSVSAVGTGQQNQKYVFYDRDILERPFRVSVRSDGATNNWTQAENIERSDPDARAYEVRTYSNRFEVIFGDDLNGLVPPNGSDITITYRVGGGSKGNIGAGAIDVSRTVSPEAPYNASVPIRFRNLSASTGGVNRETIEDAKKRAPRLFSTRGSAITEKDYAYLSIGFAHPAFGTIAKAMATVRTGLNANRVEVYALAEGTDGIPTLPSDGLKLALRNYLDEVNVITDEVVVKNGSIRAINLTLAIIMNRSADPTAVRLKAESEIKSYFNIRNWDMGEPFYISSLYEILNKIDGVSYIDILSPTDNILALNTTTELDPNSVGVHIDEVVTLGSVDSKYYYEAVR